MNHYPEHEKMKRITHLSQNIYDFLEWLQEDKGYEIGQWVAHTYRDDEFCTITESRDDLMYEFFDIDKNKFFQEKEDMIEEMRRAYD